jgi:hypothetical protein
MARNRKKEVDLHLSRIRDKLVQDYGTRHPQAQIDVKRYNSVCVYIRIIDPDFTRKRWKTREEEVWKVLETLPEDSFVQISLLVLLAPKETETSPLNFEFEEPASSLR